MLDHITRDLRFAIRQLVKSKGFTLTAIMTLALGIGANTAIFTLVHAVMLRSLPVADPGRLFRLGDGDNCCVNGGRQSHFSIYSYPLYLSLRDQAQEFEQTAAFQAGLSRVGVRRQGSASEPFTIQYVSGNYYSMFGLRPFAGRFLGVEDDRPGAPPVAVMSYRAWEQHYGADPSIVGSVFVVDGATFTIAGIAPPGFFGDTLRPNPPDFWLPLATEPYVRQRNSLLARADQHWLYIIGRLKPGASTAALESRVNAALQQWFLTNDPPRNGADRRELEHQHITVTEAGGGVAVMKLNYEQDLRLLLAVTGLVLLIACANLANLQLARGTAQAAQMSIRVALGAQRSRLVRQTLTESLVLAVLGGAFGLLVATGLAEFLIGLAFSTARYIPIAAAPSLPVLAFTFVLSLGTGVTFGIAPAWSASRSDPAGALRAAGRSAANRSTLPQRSLVVLQAAVSLVLLVGAGLMVKTLGNLKNQKFAYQSDGRIVVNVNAGLSSYSPEKIAAVYRDIESRLRQIGGVRNVALSLYGPMEGNNWQSGVTLEDHPDHMISPSWDRVSPSFFETIGARVLRGRMFDERDTPDSTHVAVVNQSFVDKFIPNENPIGKRFGMGGVEHRADYQIVGVVDNVHFRNPRLPVPPMFFVPMLQMWKSEWADTGKARSNMIGNIEMHVAGSPADLAAQVQRTLSQIDPNLTVANLTTIDEQLGNLLGHERLLARLTTLFGLLALLLAAVGLYGITAYSVARRTSEIGIRTALGARRSQVIAMIVGGALRQIAVGLLIGIPAALATGRFLASQLFGVTSSDPLIFLGAALLLVMAASVAGFAPALRASSINPVDALRTE
ncbi:MAG TPA: ABC transporter permease [Bryobacteraceae bacterium]|nr:ABC transporter permease [Bryobacteraceae bacterium]